MMSKKFKVLKFECKADDDAGEMSIEGYASVFDNIDAYGDIVRKGAFKKTLQENSKRVKFLYQHDGRMPIGIPTEMKEDSNGLFIRAKFADTTLARETHSLVKMGALDGLSIGFRTVKDAYNHENNTRELLEIALYEFSVVTFEANTEAKITSVKNQELITALENMGYTTEEAQQKAKELSLDDGDKPREHLSNIQADVETSRIIHSLKSIVKSLK